MARQRMGQHFLVGSGWRKRIIESLPLEDTKTWLEIGAGHGEMTQFLASSNRHIISIEADASLAADLQARLCKDRAKWSGVEVVWGNVLTLNLADLTGGRFRVYGNLPYYITSPILRHLFRFADRILSIHIVVQWEVAARIVASPGRRDYGYLSAACQFYTQPSIVLRLPPGAFRPPPRVMSALVTMTLPGERASLDMASEPDFLKFVQWCFGQKRKTLRNNLRDKFSDDNIREAVSACGLRPDSRAEQLTLADFAKLFRQLLRT